MGLSLLFSGRVLREWGVNARFGWTVRADSDGYRCLHEAGHAQAAILAGARVPILEMETSIEGASARARIDWEPVWPPSQDLRKLVACSGHATEHLLFRAGRVRDEEGKSFADDDFAAYALENARQDMTRFFPGAQIGVWTAAMRREFVQHSSSVVQPTLAGSLGRIVKLARLLQERATLTHDQISAVLAPK